MSHKGKKKKKDKKDKKKDHVQDRFVKGLRFFSEEDYDKSRIAFASALKNNSESSILYHMLAEALLRSGDREGGKKNYEEAYLRDKDIWIARGLANLKKLDGDEDGAIAILKECIDKNSTHPWAYLNLASFYRDRGDTDSALELLNKASHCAMELPVIWGLVQIFLEQDVKDEFQKQFSRFLVMTPKDWLGYHLLSRCFLRQDEFEKALISQDKAINLIRQEMPLCPKYLQAFYEALLAHIYIEKSFISFLLGNFDEVVNSSLNVLRNNSKLPEAMYLLGAGYLYQGLIDKGRNTLMKFSSMADMVDNEEITKFYAPVKLSAQLLVGQSYINQSCFPEAIETYKKIIQEKSDIIEAYLNGGYSYFCTGDIEASRNMFKDLLKFKPDNLLALNNLGFLEMHQGNLSGAKEYFSKAIELSPEYPLPYSNLGFILAVEGDYKKACEILLKALKAKEPEEASLKLIYPYSKEESMVKGGPPVEENRAISSHVACLCNLGTSMARSKNYRGAHICFDKLIKDLPQYHFGYRGKAWTYFLEDNLTEAASFMKKAFEKNSDHKILQHEYEFIYSMSVNLIETKKMASILEGFFTPSVPQEKPSEEFEKEIDILNLSQTSGGDSNVWDNLLVDDNRLLNMEKRVNKILEEKLKEFEMVSSWRDKIASQESEEGEGD